MSGQEAVRRGRVIGLADRLTRKAHGFRGLPKVLASHGALEVRLATTKREIRAAQRLRYRVFFEEGGAEADPTARLIRRDVCRFDSVCDHLIVVDNEKHRLNGAAKVVGAYRLLRQDVAEANFGFYSAREFNVGALVQRHPSLRFLELGRSCVAEGYRGKRTVELLWRGVWAYARWHRVDAMFGCASLPGAEPQSHAAALQFLRAEGGMNPEWAIEPVAAMESQTQDSQAQQSQGHDGAPALDARATLRNLPPLIKGYWRLGAQFSASAVADKTFGTTDIFVVLPVADIEHRYLAYFAPKNAEPSIAA